RLRRQRALLQARTRNRRSRRGVGARGDGPVRERRDLLGRALRAGTRAALDLRGQQGVIDLVIRNGNVLDGTGCDPVQADGAVEGDRIAIVGQVAPGDVPEVDATGLFVTPGFIDVHSHSDYTLLVDPRARSAIHQGVTLEVVGNCGFGCFPIRNPD